MFHDRDKQLVNIPQKQLKLQLPRINQISDFVVAKKIEDLPEVKRVFERFEETAKKTGNIDEAKRRVEEVVDSVKDVGELRRILTEFIASELNESITCMM